MDAAREVRRECRRPRRRGEVLERGRAAVAGLGRSGFVSFGVCSSTVNPSAKNVTRTSRVSSCGAAGAGAAGFGRAITQSAAAAEATPSAARRPRPRGRLLLNSSGRAGG